MRTRREVSLSGPRVMLRPLGVGDFEAWREIRIRSREWLEAWEPLPELGSPIPSPTVTRSGRDVARGNANGSSTARTGSACCCTTARCWAR